MIRRPTGSTRPYPLLPYTALFRSLVQALFQPRGAGGAFCAALQGNLAAVVRGITHCMLRVLSPSAARASVFVSSCDGSVDGSASPSAAAVRSEEHTSELQSLMRLSYAVFCLKNKITHMSQST